MPQIGPAEILVILLVGLLVFGPTKLPEIGRQVGRGLHELRKFQDTVKGELDGVLHYDEHDSSPAAVTGADTPGGNGSAPIGAADAPPALPAAETETPPSSPRGAAAAPSRFRTPSAAAASSATAASLPAPAAAKPGSRAPSRFRAPGSQPTT